MTRPVFQIALPLTAAFVLAATLPMTAQAQEECHYRRHEAKTTGTVLGVIAGGAIGGGLAATTAKGVGTVAGALIGGALGHQIGKDAVDCPDDYGYGTHYNRDGYSYNDGDDGYYADHNDNDDDYYASSTYDRGDHNGYAFVVQAFSLTGSWAGRSFFPSR